MYVNICITFDMPIRNQMMVLSLKHNCICHFFFVLALMTACCMEERNTYVHMHMHKRKENFSNADAGICQQYSIKLILLLIYSYALIYLSIYSIIYMSLIL